MGNNTFLLVGNGPYSNRGCEAIVRGTVKILHDAFVSPRFVNMNFGISDSVRAWTDEQDPDIVHQRLRSVRKWTPRWMAVKMANRLYPPMGRHLQFAELKEISRSCCAALSIGGDNYSLDYGIPRAYLQMGEYLAGCHIPLVIWGASVGPFESAPTFAKAILGHLKRDVSAIFVRESRSLDYLSQCGLAAKVHPMPDPALAMEPVPVENSRIGADLSTSMAIGLNVSPLMAKYVSNGDVSGLRAVTAGIIHALRRRVSMPIILVPHVTSPHSNDHAFLTSVLDSLEDKYGVFCLPDDLSAAETKWVISRLACLIAARTHATIAAFSSCVPVVSLAYSRKAYGINEVLFGGTEYVISPRDLSADLVAEKASAVLRQAPSIRDHLREYMTGIHQQMREAGLILKGLILGGHE